MVWLFSQTILLGAVRASRLVCIAKAFDEGAEGVSFSKFSSLIGPYGGVECLDRVMKLGKDTLNLGERGVLSCRQKNPFVSRGTIDDDQV